MLLASAISAENGNHDPTLENKHEWLISERSKMLFGAQFNIFALVEVAYKYMQTLQILDIICRSTSSNRRLKGRCNYLALGVIFTFLAYLIFSK